MMDHQPQPAPGNVEEGEGPLGARWFVGILYVFMAVVLAGWAGGWWDRGSGAGTGTASSHHTSTSAAATNGAGSSGPDSSR